MASGTIDNRGGVSVRATKSGLKFETTIRDPLSNGDGEGGEVHERPVGTDTQRVNRRSGRI